MFAPLGGIGAIAPAPNSDVGYPRDPRYGRARRYGREQRTHPRLLKDIHLRSSSARAPRRWAQMGSRGSLAIINPSKRRAYHV
jgi:hypothetical protein